MIRNDALRPIEPEAGELGEHAALVGDRRRQNDVERGEAIAGDDDEPIATGPVAVADLAAPEERRAGDLAFHQHAHSGRTPFNRSRQVVATSRATSAASPR